MRLMPWSMSTASPRAVSRTPSRVRDAVVPSLGVGVIVGSDVVAGLAGVEQAAVPAKALAASSTPPLRTARRLGGCRSMSLTLGPTPGGNRACHYTYRQVPARAGIVDQRSIAAQTGPV